MGSWIQCTCGNMLHRNLFAGAHVCVVVEDDALDAIPESACGSDAVAQIISEGDCLVRCRSCGRIAIENKQTGEVTFYLPEPRS